MLKLMSGRPLYPQERQNNLFAATHPDLLEVVLFFSANEILS